eukprot:TRINITY_DN23286_c0_g1_i3.p1 TRINITY_DN23286_c0_g1~~TRINITY_DN23286_c0_g1_i3.p1  ORF type:complete len:111 (-),score=13.45 TRINITY_DN23286_c0_g1_i3:272-604(-)
MREIGGGVMNVGVLRGRCEATHVALKHFFEQVLKLLEALFCVPLHKTPHHPKLKRGKKIRAIPRVVTMLKSGRLGLDFIIKSSIHSAQHKKNSRGHLKTGYIVYIKEEIV